MTMIKENTFDTATLNAIPFSHVAEKYDEVKRNGSHMTTFCPWHEDTHPSLVLYENNGENHCYCFACRQGGSVIDYVMQHEGLDFKGACAKLSSDFGIGKAHTPTYRPIIHRKETMKRTAYIPNSFLEQYISPSNSFCQCLNAFFDPYLVQHITEEYMLGTYSYGGYDNDVMFPSIDTNGRIRNIKLQNYDCDSTSPNFCHCDKNHIIWLGKQLIREGIIPEGYEFDNKCLFGEHLLSRYPSSTVMLVESPKNALFGAAAYPDKVWVATGNKGMLTRDALNVLSGREVIVYPDRDAIDEWKSSISTFRDIANFTVSDFCERHAPAGADKYDIADFIIDSYTQTNQPK